MLVICTHCGAHNAISSRGCVRCGAALHSQDTSANQPTTTRSASLPFGTYNLEMSIDGLNGLVEFTPTEYTVYGRQFDGETNYNAPEIDFVQRDWRVALGTIRGKVYKIALYFESESKNTVIDVSTDVMQYCRQHLGKPSEQRETLIAWDTPDGNVLLQFGKAENTYVINLFETSRSVTTFAAGRDVFTAAQESGTTRTKGLSVQRLIARLLTIFTGIALAAGAALLIRRWFPRFALAVFLVISLYWLWTGWRYTALRDSTR